MVIPNICKNGFSGFGQALNRLWTGFGQALEAQTRQIRTKISIFKSSEATYSPLNQWGVSGSEDLHREDASH